MKRTLGLEINELDARDLVEALEHEIVRLDLHTALSGTRLTEDTKMRIRSIVLRDRIVLSARDEGWDL